MYSYTPSDIGVLVKDATMEPLRKMVHLKTYKKIIKDGKSLITPCLPEEPEAF